MAQQLRCEPLQEEQPTVLQRYSRCFGDVGGVSFIFAFLIATNSIVNFDAGGTAAVLVLLSKGCPNETDRTYGHPPQVQPFDRDYPCLDQVGKGYLGAAPYVGLCCGCPLIGVLFDRFKAKTVLVVFLFMTSGATCLFSFATDKYWLLFSKFAIGLTHGTISIYAPIWVATFAPPANKTLWYGLMQSAAAIGNVLGYTVCGYLTTYHVFYQWGFRGQAIYLVLSALLLCLIPSYRINATWQERQDNADSVHSSFHGNYSTSTITMASVQRSSSRIALNSLLPGSSFVAEQGVPARQAPAEAEESADRQTEQVLWTPLRLLGNGLFSTTLISLTALYFVVTAIQYWASEFFVKVFQRPAAEVTTVFDLVSATAPIAGVVIGSSTADKLGGIGSPAQVAKICRIDCLFAFLAMLAGLVAGFVPPDVEDDVTGTFRFYVVVAGIWVQLFFGGAMLPSVSGISIESVDRADRPIAASLSMLLCNLFGFVLGVFVPGALSQRYDMRVAMQVAFCWAGFGCLGMLTASRVAKRLLPRRDRTQTEGLAETLRFAY